MSQTNEKVVDALFHDFDQADAPGAAVIVIKEGNPLFAKGYGLADLEKKIPCTTDTNFRLASIHSHGRAYSGRGGAAFFGRSFAEIFSRVPGIR